MDYMTTKDAAALWGITSEAGASRLRERAYRGRSAHGAYVANPQGRGQTD
jgi:hypothetical protein